MSEREREAGFEFLFNGRRVGARGGDTVASALVRAGVHVFSRSMKFHRPRGYYCGSGRCISCAMRVNGVPGVRTCVTRAEPGMVVESQGGFPSTRFDGLAVFDWRFPREFDYQHKFIRPRFMTPLYQRVIRRLASANEIPERANSYLPPIRRSCDALIVGSGVSGSVAHSKLQSEGIRSLYVLDMQLGPDGSVPPHAFAYYESGEVGTILERRILLAKPRALLLATGLAETGIPLVNGDLPGVLLPEAVHQLTSRGVGCGRLAVIVGTNEMRDRVVKELQSSGCSLVAELSDSSRVVRVLGRSRVSGIQTIDERFKCDTVVTLGPMVPSIELACQAGCELTSKNGLLAVKVDLEGRTSVPGVFACGSVAGFSGTDARIASAEAAASTMLRQIRGR